jgi:hypothetical protein
MPGRQSHDGMEILRLPEGRAIPDLRFISKNPAFISPD